MSRLFRSRLKRDLEAEASKFQSSVVEDLRIFEQDLIGTEAHDIMLYEQGVIPEEAIRPILLTLEEIRKEWREGRIEIGPEYEDVHEYIETRVIEKVGIKVGGMIHTGRSRNDQVVLDIRMRIREDLLRIEKKLLELVKVLLDSSESNIDTLMMLYTHSQHAQVGTFSHYLLSYVDALLRDAERLSEVYLRINRNPLGSGPIGGTSVKIDRNRTTELLGFDGLVENSLDATSSRDWSIEVTATCAILISDLSRLSSDLIEWSTMEFDYIELADEYSSSSSIMPQKKNPSLLELIRGKTGVVYGCLMELLTMVKGLTTGYSQDLQQTKVSLWRCLETTQACIDMMTGIVSTMKIKKSKMRERIEKSPVFAVELAEMMATELSLSFREAYNLSASLMKSAQSKGKAITEITAKDIVETSEKTLKKPVRVDESMLRNVVNPENYLVRRLSQGSPHPDNVKKMLETRRGSLQKKRGEHKTRKNKIVTALENMEKIVKQLTE
jgi:argininosuccinate lyase